MRHGITFLALLFLVSSTCVSMAQGIWQKVDSERLPRSSRAALATKYITYRADEATLSIKLSSVSAEISQPQLIDLPMPDGTIKQFRVWETTMMPEKLAARYPELRTFTGEAVADVHITAKLDMTIYGFHAMIFDGANTSFVDPYNKFHDGTYIAHYKRDEVRSSAHPSFCTVGTDMPQSQSNNASQRSAENHHQRTINGYQLRTYRLALAANNAYCQAATALPAPTLAQAFSEMTTTMNRVNGIYERELSVRMVFAENEDTLIWTTASGGINGNDPFALINSNPGRCIDSCQVACDRRIGSPNYDIGHVFTSGAGGLSQIAIVCQFGQKALSVTGQADPRGDGFDVDYVAHEMGHEFGADHCFNSSEGLCADPNISPSFAYEPGSGSTIMAYAGICAPDDIQLHSDAYFHAISLQQIQAFITTLGDGCAAKTATNNKVVSVPPFTASWSIPYLTPFELSSPVATDSVADTSTTYCWEQWNLGDAGSTLLNTHYSGPIFRSFIPSKSNTRIFPKNSLVLSGVLSDAGNEGAEGEKTPDVARFLTFRLTLRDILLGNGCFLIPDDTIHLDVIYTGAGFTVTSQGSAGQYHIGNSPEKITWNVVGTNTAPINAPDVDIYLSLDGGNNWQYHLGTFPNNGSAVVTLPNPDTDTHAARIKVKGHDHIFFNVNAADFTVAHSLATDTNVVIYPVPTHSLLRMFAGNKGTLQTTIFNAAGQRIWDGTIDGEKDIRVDLWARGVYVVRLTDIRNQRIIKKIVLE